jgi:hypothetical protein
VEEEEDLLDIVLVHTLLEIMVQPIQAAEQEPHSDLEKTVAQEL